MNIKILSIVAMSAMSLTSAIALADSNTVHGGSVHFKGVVINAACAVDVSSVEQTVKLGQVRTAQLNEAGRTSSSVGFNIQLVDCDTSVSKKASIAFSGTAIDNYDDVLALQNSGAGSASNVGVQILKNDGVALKLNGTDFSKKTSLNDGNNIFPFQARYFATGKATTGIANADAIFKVQYN